MATTTRPSRGFGVAYGSFGGNSLVEFIGLDGATTVERLTVTWPTSKTTQTFRGITADQSLEITEGTEAFRVLPRPAVAPTEAAAGGDRRAEPGSSKARGRREARGARP